MMEVLNWFFLFLGSIAYLVTSFFAISAFFTLRRLRNGQEHLAMFSACEFVRHNYEDVNRLKVLLAELVENEDFEQAEKVKELIASAEKEAEKALSNFRKSFSDIAEISVTRINKEGF